MAPKVVPFGEQHVGAAAGLVAQAAAAQRRRVPLLPPTLEDSVVTAGLLGDLVGNGLGVAVLDRGRLLGFLAGMPAPLWGSPGVYVTEWGSAARDPDVLLAAYGDASRLWVGAGRPVHAVSTWAGDAPYEAAWHTLGFGRVVVDAVRGLEAISGRGEHVRRAEATDAGAVGHLERSLWEHLAAPPASRAHPEPAGIDQLERRLRDPREPVWIVEAGGQSIGYLSLTSGEHETTVLATDDTVVCDGAFVVPGARRRGAGSSLLAAALAWARTEGFARLAVDYESANLEAAKFWSATGFRSVVHSVARTVVMPKGP